MTRELEPQGRHYLAVFLISLSVLMLEIAFARVLSVALYSHYAFVAVSLAMFGLGVSGLVVYLLPEHFTADRLDEQLVAYAWRFAMSAALSIVVFLRIHVVQSLSMAGFFTLSLAYLVLAIPFFFAGVCLSLLMTHFAARIGRIYGADLIGASLGCLGVVVAMSLVPAPYVAAYVATVIATATLALALATAPRRRWVGPLTAVVIAAGVLALAQGSDLLRMKYIKAWASFYSDHEAWNAFSRVSVLRSLQNAAQQLEPQKASREYADPWFPPAMEIDIDGAAWTPMVKFGGDFRRLDFLRRSVLYAAHHLRPNADVLIIGTGGGRDLLAAKTFAQPTVLGIEINPLMRDTVQEVYGDYSGRPYTLPGVEVIIDEARSRLSTLPRRFGVIQLSLIDTFSLNAAGGFVFSENYLYTQEGFQEYFRHLANDGILSISRYYTDTYRLEMLRVAAMVRAAWHSEGVQRPADHVVVIGQGAAATLLAKRTPFSAAELERLGAVATENDMRVLYQPDRPDTTNSDLTAVLTTPDFDRYLADYPFLIAPATDDRPFFFHFLRGRWADFHPTSAGYDPFQFFHMWQEALLLMYLLLAVVTVLALAFFVGPLLILRRRGTRILVRGAVPMLGYFACLGYGFMMIEVPLLQHFVLLLGYPVYSLAVVLFALLLFSGIGSLLSGRLAESAPTMLTVVLATIVVMAGTYAYVVPAVINVLIGTSLWMRILATVGLLAPIGIALGMAYPLGITVLRMLSAELVPWAWGLNGVLSVVASVLAIFIGSRVGFTVAFLTGAGAYAVALVTMRLALIRSRGVAPVEELSSPRPIRASY